MASIVKKTIRGKPYYYARECKRVDGKPKIVWQKYLAICKELVTVEVGEREGLLTLRYRFDNRAWEHAETAHGNRPRPTAPNRQCATGNRRSSTMEMTLSQMSADQRALFAALDLGRYLAA
jgi:hypothetical protein